MNCLQLQYYQLIRDTGARAACVVEPGVLRFVVLGFDPSFLGFDTAATTPDLVKCSIKPCGRARLRRCDGLP
jgi:hypothetical protein